jgi:uncharacterized protein YjbI with pentapeptide repeats
MGTENLSRQEIEELKSRWLVINSENRSSAQDLMIERLKKDCTRHNKNRPVALDLRGISILNEDLSNLDLSDYDFSHSNLDGTDFSGTNFSYSKLQFACLEHTKIDKAEFLGADLSSSSLNECAGNMCGFGGAILQNTSIINAKLKHASFSHSKLIHTDFRATSARDSKFSESDLSNSIFTRAKLTGCDFKYSNVSGANFEQADLKNSRLLGIKSYQKASWIGADIRDINLIGAYLIRRHIADENYVYEFRTRSGLHQFLYLLWWISSDCGRSLLRWLVWLLFGSLLFAAIYSQLEIDYGDYETVFSPIYFSIVTLTTLGYGDAIPMSFTGQLFVTIQAFFGYMGLGILLSILGNKLARRAD